MPLDPETAFDKERAPMTAPILLPDDTSSPLSAPRVAGRMGRAGRTPSCSFQKIFFAIAREARQADGPPPTKIRLQEC